tara:strand:+ start:730 stop:1659 length:930 start_codon:yes stop_codon:yes gene_type:complete
MKKIIREYKLTTYLNQDPPEEELMPEFEQFAAEIANEGFSTKILKQAYPAKREISTLELIKDLQALPEAIKLCEKAEGGSKVISALLVGVFSSMAKIAAEYSKSIADYIGLAKSVGENAPLARDAADASHARMAELQSFEHYFGFDDQVIERISNNLGKSMTQDDHVDNIDGIRTPSILRKLKTLVDQEKTWNMREFQQYCVNHYEKDRKKRIQYAQHIPEHTFVDWSYLVKHLTDFNPPRKFRQGINRWLVQPLDKRDSRSKKSRDSITQQEESELDMEKAAADRFYDKKLMDLLTYPWEHQSKIGKK